MVIIIVDNYSCVCGVFREKDCFWFFSFVFVGFIMGWKRVCKFCVFVMSRNVIISFFFSIFKWWMSNFVFIGKYFVFF